MFRQIICLSGNELKRAGENIHDSSGQIDQVHAAERACAGAGQFADGAGVPKDGRGAAAIAMLLSLVICHRRCWLW